MQFQGRVLLVAHTYEQLRTAIMRGEIPPGEKLTEAHLAERLGVSRTPIREALGRLESEGVVMRDGSGLVATRLDAKAASEVLLIRELLEPYCAETSAPALTPAELARLDSLVAEMRAAATTDGGNVERAELNIRFHDALYERCPHPRLLGEVRRNRDHIVTYRLYDTYATEESERIVREHARIARLARDVAEGRRDSGELGLLIKSHISDARRRFERDAAELAETT